MATIRRVTIHRLRNVTPGCTFELHPGLNVLLGQNGTGKTTLLQWMAGFMSGKLESWSNEPYRVEVEMEAVVEADRASLRLLVDNEISELPEDPEAQHGLDTLVSLGDAPLRTNLQTTKLTIELGDQSYEIQERPEHLSVYVNGALLVESPHRLQRFAVGNWFGGTLWKAVMALNTRAANTHVAVRDQSRVHLGFLMEDALGSYPPPISRFDESLGFFQRIVAGPESEPQAVFYESRPVTMQRLIPDELFQLIESKYHAAESDISTLVLRSEEAQGFLSTAVQLFQYRSAAVHLDLLEKDAQSSKYGNLRFTFHRHDGSIIGHDALSYGQKRMLSFLYYLALHPRFIIVDELVNGLHHAWIEACIDEIGDRQGVLTSQNPLLLDHMSFESADEVRQRFILCRSERKDGREQLTWRNPTQEEAESFFRAYQAGIQHIGEILVDKGLW